MKLKILGGQMREDSEEYRNLISFCQSSGQEICLEWIDGQYWLHSDDPKENPVSVMIDRELERHLSYFKKSSIHKEILARALGIKSGVRPKVLDLTGGFLGDTLLMLSFGCEVTTLERHPVVSFLIKSALANSQHPLLANLNYIASDAETYLRAHSSQEVIFFDPMFEDANEKTLPKKEMRIFRSVVGKDLDAKDVWALGLSCRPKRLVVKRPRLSVALGNTPDILFEGKATRYDVYLPKE
jgi:16S rRNA (guanine1516-N2)-methyltransferase